MKLSTLLCTAGCLAAITLASGSKAQERCFTAEKLGIDDGIGHTVTLQAPIGLLAPVTFTFPLTGGTLLTSATGFLNSITAGTGITVTNALPTATISVSSTYAGGSAITTLGTIGTGTWNAGSISTSNAAGITASGGPLTSGASGAAGSLKIFPASGSALSITTTSNGGTYILPSPATTSGYLLSTNGSGTLSWVAPGSTLAGGVTNAIPKWTGTASIGNSNISDNGATVQIGISGSGGVLGSLALANTNNSNLVKIQPSASSAAYTVSLPVSAPLQSGDVLTYTGVGSTYSWSQPPSASVTSISDDDANAITSTSTVDATVTGSTNYSFTPSAAGDYLISFSTWIEGAGSSVAITKNGVRISGTSREQDEKKADKVPLSTQAYCPNLTTSDVIEVVWKSLGSSSTMHDRNMIIQRVK